MKKRTLALLMAMVLMLTLAFTACGNNNQSNVGESNQQSNSAEGKTLNFVLSSEPPELDPQITTDATSITVLNAAMEGLVRVDKDNTFMPGMAESWTISDDKTVYTFKIRSDAKWSNGEALTADDCAYGIIRALNPATASQYAYILYDIKGAAELNSLDTAAADFDAKYKEALANLGVKAEGNTVTITLAQPAPYFLGILAFPTALPCNEKFASATEGYGAEANKLLYNGPWVISEWVHDDKVVFTKNENYWNKDNIALDTMNGYVILDSNAALTMFYNGDLDLVGVPGAKTAEVKSKGYEISQFSDGGSFYLEFNTTDKLLSNAKIRQAISAALDRQTFITGVVKNNSLPATGFVPNGTKGLDGEDFREKNGTLIVDNDTETAKKLFAEGLAELGITAADAKLSMICDDTDTGKLYAAAVQDMLKKNLDIEITIDSVPFKTRIQKMRDKDFQIVFAGWSPDYNDAMTYIDMFTTGNGNNHTSYASAEYDKLIFAAKKEADANKRIELMYAAEKLLMQDMPIAPVYFRYRDWTAKEGINGVVRRAIGADLDLYWTTKD